MLLTEYTFVFDYMAGKDFVIEAFAEILLLNFMREHQHCAL